MKLSFKTILPIILISALLILLNGCMGTVPDEEPGYTPGTITGIIAAPCCSTSAEPVSETCCIAPEYWCFYCQNTWNLQDAIEVVLTYGEDEVATVFTNEDGEFTFTNVDPGKNYVITAYCLDFGDNRPLVKDVALELIEGSSFDTKITDLVSTSLGLVVDFLVLYTDWGPEDISLDEVLADRPNFPNFPKFKKLVYEVRRVVENCEVNLLTDDEVQYALCLAAEEISKLTIGCGPGYTPPPPPPNPCAGNTAPSISSVLLDGTAVSIGETVHVVVGTPYVITVNASDDGVKDPLTYSATIDGITVGTVTSNVVTVTPLVVGTFEVYVKVNDGCTTTTWGPVTVVVDPVTYVLTTAAVPPEGGSVSGSGTYNSGTVVPVTATPALGWTFTGWSGDLSGTTNPDNVTMNSNKSVTANFTQDCYNLVVTIVGSGSVDQSPLPGAGDCYLSGTNVTLTPTAALGWTFAGWSGVDSGDISTPAPYIITMDSNKAVTANFEETADVTINYVATTGGSVDNASETLAPATGVAVGSTATADPGYSFVNWTDSGANEVSTSAYFVPDKVGGLNVAATYTANFDIIQYTITATAGPGGTISPIGDVIVDHGADQNFTMIPDLEYRVADVLVDGVSVGAVLDYDFTNVTANHTIHVTFELNPCCDLDEKLTVNSIEWYKDPSDDIWKVQTDCKVVDNTCSYWLTVKAELINPSLIVEDDDSNTAHGQEFTAKSTLSSELGGDTAPIEYSVKISFYDRDGLCEPYVQEFDVPYSI